MESIRSVVVYEDDSVDVSCCDGSHLQLSSCGTEFLFEKVLPSSAHPLQQPERTKQRTQFAISKYREQLLHALEIRNQFAVHPFLPANILPSDCKTCLFVDISEVTWPSSDAENAVRIADRGRVEVSSIDGYAFLYLSPLQLEFTVKFLSKVSQKSTSVTSDSEKRETNHSVVNEQCLRASKMCIPGAVKNTDKLDNKENMQTFNKKHFGEMSNSKKSVKQKNVEDSEAHQPYTKYLYEYVWMVQHHSVSCCPEEWKYPLSLALYYSKLQDEKNTGNCGMSRQKTEDTGTSISAALNDDKMYNRITVLPKVLPLNCRAPHLHRWSYNHLFLQRDQGTEENSHHAMLKVVWCKGILYRLISGAMNTLEVYPGDGSVLKTQGAVGNYFIHYQIKETSGQREERMYAVSNLPPDPPGCNYSVRSIITQATRFLQSNYQTKLSLKLPDAVWCWKPESSVENAKLPVLLEETSVPHTGQFVAYSDGKVHAVFVDGVTLHMMWEFGSHCESTQVCEYGFEMVSVVKWMFTQQRQRTGSFSILQQ
ncbi:uncharacterized protein C5orf34 homolog [Latimeria chalumnae]|uniref:uncharacterized protein C5orf34 homolog n=1 Tax=Latimeria chalumnae TaxID=7897 RepID=UPI00313C543B